MKKQAFSTMLASATILGSSMVGCSGARMDNRPALTAEHAPDLGARVEKALVGKDYARALMQAEQLVAATPRDPAARALLGRAYLANGRYASARIAFEDSMSLGNRDPRIIVSLSMARTGLGDAQGARDLLSSSISDLPAGDYGLAMAMAGDPREGVRALLEAVKQPEATARTRQNLAYALALAGAWGQARLIAGQDLSAREAEARMAQWSHVALNGNERSRVFAMIGVEPRQDDSGLPERLALNAAPAPVELAAADDLVAQARADVAAQAVEAVAEPVPVAIAQVEEVPIVRAPADPMREAARTAFARAASEPVRPTRVAAIPASDAKASDWVIQLGAFDSPAIARTSWAKISRIAPAIAAYPQVHSKIAVNGRAFHRVAIRGFVDRKAADGLCRSLRASAQNCFVRLDETGATRTARTRATAKTEVAAR